MAQKYIDLKLNVFWRWIYSYTKHKRLNHTGGWSLKNWPNLNVVNQTNSVSFFHEQANYREGILRKVNDSKIELPGNKCACA